MVIVQICSRWTGRKESSAILLYNRRMGIDQEVIDEITRRVTKVAPAERIILFGSAATGKMIKGSDIDLLILERDIEDPWGERRRVREALCDMVYPFDIILMTTDRFEETKNVIGGISYPASRYGKVIYEAV